MASRTTYRWALAVALGTAALLLWAMGALGIVGTEGDRTDLLYLVALVMGISGAIVARFEPSGMARAMTVTTGATVLVGLIALLLGKHQAEHSSVLEILGLTVMFAGLFGASAWLFRSAGQQAGARPSRAP